MDNKLLKTPVTVLSTLLDLTFRKHTSQHVKPTHVVKLLASNETIQLDLLRVPFGRNFGRYPATGPRNFEQNKIPYVTDCNLVSRNVHVENKHAG